MKKTLLKTLSGILIFTSVSLIAQPTLTAPGINFVVGENFTLYTTSSVVNPGSAGANQTWNLSAMGGSSAGITNVVAPSSTTNASSYPGSNVAWNNLTGGTNYFTTSSTALKFNGVAQSSVISYSNPEDFLHYPFTYNNSYVDAFSGSYSSGGTWYRNGTVTVTADGYGTLITPNGTYTNVLRVHLVEVYKDSMFFGSPYVITTNSDQYKWYKNGIHVEVAQIYTLTTSMGTSNSGGAYVTGNVGINEASDLIIASDLFPNPASNKITLDFTLTESKNANVAIYNLLGQNMNLNTDLSAVQGKNSVEINIDLLPEGIYFAQIALEGNVSLNKRFVVSK